VIKVAVLLATGMNAEGYREILGMQVSSTEDGAGWLTFFRDLAARGHTGVKLVTSDAHAGLVAAAGATLPGAGWQRCRTHYAANLMSTTPKSSWPWVKTLLSTVFDQPDADAVHAQFDRVLDALEHKLPSFAHLEAAREEILAFTVFPKEVWCLADVSESACVAIGKRGRGGRKARRAQRVSIRRVPLPR